MVPARARTKRKVKYPALVVKDSERRRKASQEFGGRVRDGERDSSPVEEISLTALTGKVRSGEGKSGDCRDCEKYRKESRSSDYFNRLERVAEQSETDRIHHGIRVPCCPMNRVIRFKSFVMRFKKESSCNS